MSGISPPGESGLFCKWRGCDLSERSTQCFICHWHTGSFKHHVPGQWTVSRHFFSPRLSCNWNLMCFAVSHPWGCVYSHHLWKNSVENHVDNFSDLKMSQESHPVETHHNSGDKHVWLVAAHPKLCVTDTFLHVIKTSLCTLFHHEHLSNWCMRIGVFNYNNFSCHKQQNNSVTNIHSFRNNSKFKNTSPFCYHASQTWNNPPDDDKPQLWALLHQIFLYSSL